MAIWTPSDRYKPHSRSALGSLMSILDAASVGILAVYPDGRFAYENEVMEQALEYDQQELTERKLFDVLNADNAWTAEQLAILARGDPWSGNVNLERRSGGSVAFAANAFSTDTPEGPAYIGLLHTSLDDETPSERVAGEPAFSLSTREVCTVLLMCEGFADKEIASLLGTSVWTVNKEVGSILRKMSVSSRTEACIRALRANLIL